MECPITITLVLSELNGGNRLRREANHDLYFGDKTGKEASSKSPRCESDLDFDNDWNEVTRDFIDGTNLKLINRSEIDHQI